MLTRSLTFLMLCTAAVAACTSQPPPPPPQPESVAVCVEASTFLRVEDHHCPVWEAEDDTDLMFFPYFYPPGFHAHAIGQPVSGGSMHRPAGHIIFKAPSAGGTTKTYRIPAVPPKKTVHKPAVPTTAGKPAAPPPVKPADPPRTRPR